jgi:predicted CoA-binding protein
MNAETIKKYQDPKIIKSALNRKKIAVVGMSSKQSRASHKVGAYLKENGYKIYPVNPNETQILDMKCYSSLLDIKDKIDVVNVFRESSAVPQIAYDSIKIEAEFMWLQLDVISSEGTEIATQRGINCIVDLCIKIEHARYIGNSNSETV